VAYLECREWVPRGLGTEVPIPPEGSRGKVPVCGLGSEVLQKLKLSVNECLHFDVLEEKKLVKCQKYHNQKSGSAEGAARRKTP